MLSLIEPHPPPNMISLAHAQPGPVSELTFNWTQVTSDCADTQYQIISDCGQCPRITNFTTVVCNGVHIPIVCAFEVATVVCGNNISEDSDYGSLNISLKGV